MSPQAKREYVERVSERYARMNRRGKGMVLDEFCRIMGCHRKHAIRLLGGPKHEKAKPPGPPRRYGAEEFEVLKAIWLAAEQPCGKRLVAALAMWLPAYGRRFKLKATTARSF